MAWTGKRLGAGSWFRLVRIACALPLVLVTLNTAAAQVKVFAAISLRESLREIADQFEKATGDKIVFCLGASSLLARQIEAGATPDVFLSADEARMDALQSKGSHPQGIALRSAEELPGDCCGRRRRALRSKGRRISPDRR